MDDDEDFVFVFPMFAVAFAPDSPGDKKSHLAIPFEDQKYILLFTDEHGAETTGLDAGATELDVFNTPDRLADFLEGMVSDVQGAIVDFNPAAPQATRYLFPINTLISTLRNEM